MKSVPRIAVEVVAIGAVGLALGLANNQLRDDGLAVTYKYYRDQPVVSPRPAPPHDYGAAKAEGIPSAPIPGDDPPPNVRDTTPEVQEPDNDPAAGDSQSSSVEDLLSPPPVGDDGLARLDTAHAQRHFESPEKQMGLTVFVDARSNDYYEEGHIPGAVHLDRYRMDKDFAVVSSYLYGANTVIVYCNGGDCEDSVQLAYDLATKLPTQRIMVYEGGMNEWREQNLPIEQGTQQ